MKRVIVTMMTMLLIAANVEAIKPKLVKYSFNVKTINKEMGDTRTKWTLTDRYGGWCYVPSVGHNGLLIYKNSDTGMILVYDRKCPVCDKRRRNSTVNMDSSVDAKCLKCRTIFNVYSTGAPLNNSTDTECWLESYATHREGNMIHVDNSMGLRQRQILASDEEWHYMSR